MIGEVVTQYRLEAELGRGTYGVVYRGVHVAMPELRRAVKVLHPALLGDPEFHAAISNEVRLLVQLDHPGIVKLHDLVVEPTRLALLLELLEGDDLLTRVGRGRRPIAEVADVLLQMLDALGIAHARGIVHCDIKPANVFRCHDGRVKLMDFGVSKAAGKSRATRTGQIAGTLDYMAPEVFEGRVSPAADVYAAGLVAWELLAGRAACDAESLPQKMNWHTNRGPADLLTERGDAPAWLREAIRLLTARDLATRPATGAEAAERVRALRPQLPPDPGPRPPDTVTIPTPGAATGATGGAAAATGGAAGATGGETGGGTWPGVGPTIERRPSTGGEAMRVLAIAGLFAVLGVGGTLGIGIVAALVFGPGNPEEPAGPVVELDTEWLTEIPEEDPEPHKVAPPPAAPAAPSYRLSELLAAAPATPDPATGPSAPDVSGDEWDWLRDLELDLPPPPAPPQPKLRELADLKPTTAPSGTLADLRIDPPQQLTETWLRIALMGHAAALSGCGATLAAREASNLELKVTRDFFDGVQTTTTRGGILAGFCVSNVVMKLSFPANMHGTASVTFTHG